MASIGPRPSNPDTTHIKIDVIHEHDQIADRTTESLEGIPNGDARVVHVGSGPRQVHWSRSHRHVRYIKC